MNADIVALLGEGFIETVIMVRLEAVSLAASLASR